jgi:hypothetical protein
MIRRRYMKVLITFFVLVFILYNMNCSTEPKEDPQLKITNGFYEVTNEKEDMWEYSINFEYSVSGTTCYISGYSITTNDSSRGTVIWDGIKKLIPGVKYSMTDIFNTPVEWRTDPIISLQGSATGIKLNADYKLELK